MRETEPIKYHDWSLYMRLRQAMLSAATFNSSGWNDWEVGHAKLTGILLYHYEQKKQASFKYSKTMKKECYRRTHNYRLLKGIIKNGILSNEGNGYYTLPKQYLPKIDSAIKLIKQLDRLGQDKIVKTP